MEIFFFFMSTEFLFWIMKGSRNGLCNYCITLRLYLLPLSYTLQMVKNDKSSVCLPQCFLKRSTLKNWGGGEVGRRRDRWEP